MFKITVVAGARPNFIKIAPIINQIKVQQEKGLKIEFRLVHTGQHYDRNLSDSFFQQLSIPEPNVNLEVGSGTQAEQTSNIMVKFEKELLHNKSDLVIVVGDVNSTMACTLVAKKMSTPVAHVEAGIRSFDMTMPEEINRMVTDSIADYFFTTSEVAGQNLRRSGITDDRIFFVGNTMIDTLYSNLKVLIKPDFYNKLKLSEQNYFLLTLHRPSNVDDAEKLKEIINEIYISCKGIDIIFPVHPRTSANLSKLNLAFKNFHFVDPLGYLEFIYLVKNAKCVITDSGGVQEETTVLNIPCMTLRDNTERPETVTYGSNKLLGSSILKISTEIDNLFSGNWKISKIPPLWDGRTSERILDKIIEVFHIK